jgi:hypothetical protein
MHTFLWKAFIFLIQSLQVASKSALVTDASIKALLTYNLSLPSLLALLRQGTGKSF